MEVSMITCMQRLVLYETKARYYVVGSNNTQTRYRVLKIDRTEPRELVISDDKLEYSKQEIHNVLMMIDEGNKIRHSSRGLIKTVSAFGIIGFVRFLEGYYIILITKRRKTALIGPHSIYKVEETSMLYIPNDTVRYTHPDESRYLKMFQNIDLSSNFYFSYSYDLTQTLQYNLAPAAGLQNILTSDPRAHSKQLFPIWDNYEEQEVGEGHEEQEMVELSREEELQKRLFSPQLMRCKSIMGGGSPTLHQERRDKLGDGRVLAVRGPWSERYAWNSFLLSQFTKVAHRDWILPIIHGFVGQSKLNVHGRPIFLLLIGRRSSKNAGTRFLKRGINSEGNVANEIETEQIVFDGQMTFLDKAHFSSFVQLRGSVPLHWSQDVSKMVPKPPIALDQRDPYCQHAGMHFNEVHKRYGAPVIILNLVKTREKRQHETILTQDFKAVVNYLNQFLAPAHSIQYIGFDMARVNKRKGSDVLLRLAKIVKYCVKQTGFYLHLPANKSDKIRLDPEFKSFGGVWSNSGCRQTGVVRTNCVDCLDRTNTAQFAVGKSALAYQLYALSVLEEPRLEFDTDCIKMLEELYEDHGDTLALQYGGSQLVHRIKGYRKVAPWTSHSRDIMQTLSRYYSNAFSDLEKQQAINLFLGVFVPREGRPNLWELPSDFYLHNPVTLGIRPRSRNTYTQWWDSEVSDSLPLPSNEETKSLCKGMTVMQLPPIDERVNQYWDYYRPYEITSLSEHFAVALINSVKDFMPKNATNPSPFVLRIVPENQEKRASPGISVIHVVRLSAIYRFASIRRRFSKHVLLTSVEANPNISGKDSTVSMGSVGSEGSTSSTDDSDVEASILFSSDSSSDSDNDVPSLPFRLQDCFQTMQEVYDCEITDPNKRDQKLYERYSDMGQCLKKPEITRNVFAPREAKTVHDIFSLGDFKLDNFYSVEPPPVSRQAQDIYRGYLLRGQYRLAQPVESDISTYMTYVSNKYM